MSFRFVVVLMLIFNSPLFSQVSPRTLYGVLMDNTGSLRNEIENERALAKEIVNFAKAGSAFSIFKFDNPKTGNAVMVSDLECSSDKSLVVKEIDDVYTLGGQTTLSDAVLEAGLKVTENKPPKCEGYSESVLILLTASFVCNLF